MGVINIEEIEISPLFCSKTKFYLKIKNIEEIETFFLFYMVIYFRVRVFLQY